MDTLAGCCVLTRKGQTAMNPFQTAHTPIRSAVFDGRVRQSAKKYL
jgi:hypothetical protein